MKRWSGNETIVYPRKVKFLSQGRQIVMSSTVNKWNNPIISPRGTDGGYGDFYKVLSKITNQFIWLSQLPAN